VSERSRRAAAIPVPVRADDAAPAARWKHGQDLEPPPAPRMASKVASGVWTLRQSTPPAIGDAEVVAAERFRKDYVLGIEGVRQPSLALRSGSADFHDVQILRADAVTRHREIADVLGPRMTAWLVDFVVFDLSLRAMQKRYLPGPQYWRTEMRGRLTVVLIVLSQLYAAIDQRKRKPGDGGLLAVAVAALGEAAVRSVRG
jgi:hypothetical protein